MDTPRDTPQLLVQKAFHAFRLHSYEGSGVQEICTAAGVTKPSLYHYFGSKRGLLSAVVKKIMAPLENSLAQVPAYSGDLPKTLTDITWVFFSYAEKYPEEFRYFMVLRNAPEDSESQAAVCRYSDYFAEYMIGLFEKAAHDHGNMRKRHKLLGVSFLGMLFTFGLLISEKNVRLDNHFVYLTVHQFSHGIYS